MAGLRYPQQSGYCRAAAAMNLLLGVFHVLLPCFRPGEAQGQAIEPIPGVVELWQAEEGELLLPAQMPPNGRALHFHPSVLHFGILLGLPRAKMLQAYNPSRDREVVVNSVFTATRQFHVSPAHSRVIPVMGKISFRVLFLPTEEGSIESSLFINTSSHGLLSYQVFGMGTLTSSPEEPRVQLANAYLLLPHIENIQASHTLAETMNASLLRVHLECSLPNDAYQQVKSCCFMSGDPVLLEMSLMVRMENAQQDFVDHRQYLLENLFVVYVAMEKTKTSGATIIMVVLLEGLLCLVFMQGIRQLSQKDTSPVEFEPVLLSSSSTNFTKVASIPCKGTATLKACLSCPVMEGYFDVDPSAALFHIEPHHNTSGFWSIWFTNNFDFSIELNEVFIAREVKNILKILNFAEPLTLPPGCWNVFSLKLGVKDVVTNVLSSICLTTNVGVMFEIPLQIYSTVSKQGDLRFEATAYCDIQCYLGKSDSANLLWQKSLSLDRSAWDVDSELASDLYERWQKIRHGEACSRRSILGSARFIYQKKPKEESFAFFLPRLTTEPGLTLNFSATAVKSSMVKYFVLRNPSSFPVTLQLLPLSYYPDPQASLNLLNKWFGINVQAINFTTTEFKLMDECSPKKCSSELLWLSLQPLETRKVGVIFTPVDYKRVASLILIRNNLTVLDVVSVEGFGAKELLKVGGRLPGAGGSLRFKVPEATLMDCRRQLKDSKQILSITKNFKVENIGPLPITISSMKINGYSCQGYGFEVLDCQEFFLAQNSSREISIVFTPDFTSSWVIRELTLVTAADLEFHFTLNVTLPHHLLPLCADVVPGPSWEESFWRLTVLFVSLSLLGVILIAFQQAQYILAEFMKSRQRPNPSSSPQQNSNSVDVISSDSYNCKTFMDSYSSSDKGKGKGFLSVGTSSSRSQNAAKRSPATYSHSQKKHKCSVYYSKQKPNTAAGSAIAAPDEKQNQIAENHISAPKEDICTDVVSENWVTLKYANGINVNKNLTVPEDFLDKEESALKNTVLIKNTSSECDLKEDLQTCMFPKETNLKTSENLVELKEQEFCPVKMSKKLPESHLSRNSPQQQPELQEISRKNSGNFFFPVSIKDAYRKKKPQEKKEGNLPNMNWNRNRTSRKNKKKNVNIRYVLPHEIMKKSSVAVMFLQFCISFPFPFLGLYPTGDLWPAQPVCLTNSLNYNLENNIPCMIQETPSVHNSFIDWNAACDSQFSNMYCPLEMNEYGAFPEENMNYPSGFPGTAAVQNTAFIDQNCPSTWNAPPNMPPAWEPANYVNSTPYLSSTRSLSPMSGLFGSIWAPQSDVYESCCPVSATAQHSTHVENQAVMCKQEYYPRFNPFRAYMNLDIWTTAANRNANFPLSRDSGYCGNV
uniref:Transmembrane 131 like n=1 Tax=Falco tinnunculus TaxID=100819 RepID=A0A8C4TSN7_FALTI